jgi:hypothetical protein
MAIKTFKQEEFNKAVAQKVVEYKEEGLQEKSFDGLWVNLSMDGWKANPDEIATALVNLLSTGKIKLLPEKRMDFIAKNGDDKNNLCGLVFYDFEIL